MTKQEKMFCAFQTSGGKYSSRKVPRWQMGRNDLLEYLDMLRDEWEDTMGVFSIASLAKVS